MSRNDATYLAELLASAETPEDLAAIEQLLAEQEARTAAVGKWRARTLAEVAQFFGLAVQTVKQWRTESPPMPGGDGGYDLSEVVRWRLAKLQNSGAMDALQWSRPQLRTETTWTVLCGSAVVQNGIRFTAFCGESPRLAKSGHRDSAAWLAGRWNGATMITHGLRRVLAGLC